MVAAKNVQQNETEETLEATPNPLAERIRLKEKLQHDIGSRFDSKKRDTVSLLVVALAHANNPNADDKHIYFKTFSEILGTPVDIDLIHRVTSEYRDNPLDIFDAFLDRGDQASLLQALVHCVESEQLAGKTELALNYHQIQKSVRAEDVLRDVISFLLTRNISIKKSEGVVVKPEDVLKELLDTKALKFDAKELLKARYFGHWKTVLEKAERHIQELLRIQNASRGRSTPLSAHFQPYSMTSNKVLEKFDKAIHFTSDLSESDVYTLLGIVGHASSADGQQTDAAEVQFLKDLIQRLHFNIDKARFPTSIARPLSELMSQVKSQGLAKAVYFETMCMMTSNLEITPEEKDMLNQLANAFNLPANDILLLHTRHYIDSGLRGVEDSLQAMPAMLKSAHHSLHKFQEILSELGIVPLADIVKTGKEYLEALETIDIPKDIPAEVRVAILSLVGNAMRLDNVFDEGERAFLQKTMKDLGLSGDDVKLFPQLMKQATVPDLCLVIKKWATSQKKSGSLSSAAYYVLHALSADGVIDEKEDKFKTLFFRELGLEPTQYARMLLRVQLDFVN